MMTMYWLRGVYLAGLFLVPLTSAINSTSQQTTVATEVPTTVPNLSTSSEPTTADNGSSTLDSKIPATISMTLSPSLTTRGNANTRQETVHPATTSSDSQQPNTTASLVQTPSSPAGTVSTVTSSTIAGYVFLVIIVIALAVLCWVLITLRRKSRWYSFDFKYPVLLTDPPGSFETVNMDGLNTVDLSPLPASNGECLLDQEVLRPSSGCLPLDTEQTDSKWDQSDGVSLHITEEEPENSTALSGSTAP